MKKITLSIAATALGVVGATSPATAGTPTVQTQSVSYADLNLTSAEGQEALEWRLKSAARKVCRYKEHSPYEVRSRSIARKCYATAMAKAKKQQAAIIEDERRGG